MIYQLLTGQQDRSETPDSISSIGSSSSSQLKIQQQQQQQQQRTPIFTQTPPSNCTPQPSTDGSQSSTFVPPQPPQSQAPSLPNQSPQHQPYQGQQHPGQPGYPSQQQQFTGGPPGSNPTQTSMPGQQQAVVNPQFSQPQGSQRESLS